MKALSRASDCQSTRGLILPSALRLRGEKTGVYVLEPVVVQYREVEVIATEAEQMVVRGLPTGIPVITNPFLVSGTEIMNELAQQIIKVRQRLRQAARADTNLYSCWR